LKFVQSVSIAPFVSKDAYHKVTYGTAVTVKANVDYIIKNMIDSRGNEIVTSAWIALPAGTSLTYDSKITLPDGSTPYIGSIAPAVNFRTGNTEYIEVYVSRLKPGESV